MNHNDSGRFTRRAFLHVMAAAGVGAVTVRMGPTRRLGLSSSIEDALPDLHAEATAIINGGVQTYVTRPELKVPAVTVTVPATRSALPGLVVTECHGSPAQQGPLVLDESGQVVWFLPLSAAGTASLRAFNVQVQTYRGQPVMAWFQGAVVAAHGQGHYVLYSPEYKLVAEVHAAGGYQADLHEFVLTDQGTALFTCYGHKNADLSRYGGPKAGSYFYGVAQEIELSTGKLLFEWRSDDHVGLANSYVPAPKSDIPWDYFHINAICIDPTDGNLVISGRNTWTFYKVDRTTGKILWQAGGMKNDFAMGAGTAFAFQHDVRLPQPGRVTVFNNDGGPPDEATQSSALVLALDEKARRIDLVHKYLHTPPVMSQALGSVQDLTKGHHFVGWGQSSYFTEYDASGNVVFDGRLAAGTVSYRAFKQSWQGRPASLPDVAVHLDQGTAIVYVSWNGATAVQGWQVLGGASSHDLQPIGLAPKAGFETAITVPHPPGYVAVEALDASGKLMSRSGVVRLT